MKGPDKGRKKRTMYTKILLVVIIFILSAFFYLHTQNPGTVTFVVTKEYTYTLPSTLILFAGFFMGVIVAVLNSLLVDAKKAVKEMSARREKRVQAQADENYKKGIEALVKGDTTVARELIEKAVKARPSDTGRLITLSETYVRENRLKEALKVLENGFSNNSNSVGLLVAIARCSSEAGDTARAARAFNEIIKIDPNNPYALKRLRDFKIGAGQWAEAAALQRTLYGAERDEALKAKEKRLLTGLLYESATVDVENGRLSEAVAKVKEVLKNDDGFMPAHLLLGEALSRQGNTASAIKVWEKARDRYPNSEPLFLKLEELYLKESAPEKILDRYKREINANPYDTRLRLLLSRLYLRLEMVDNAIEELERLVLEGEDSYYPQVLLGEAYLRRKQGNKAAALFHKALGLDKEFIPPFLCSNCNHNAKTWVPRCPSCGEWNTLYMFSSASASKVTPLAVVKKAF